MVGRRWRGCQTGPVTRESDGGFLSRQAVLGVYLPTMCFETGMGAIMPVIAPRTSELGGSLAAAGVLSALLGVGLILGDVPAGALAARVGDRRALLLAAVATSVALAGCALAGSVLLLAVGLLLTGATNAVYLLARQTYLVDLTPVLYRARALSVLGGVSRVGVFVGPFLGAGVVHLGGPVASFWLALGVTAVGGVVVLLVPDVEAGPHVVVPPATSLRQMVREHARVYATVGMGVMLVGAVRAARQTALPLWSEHIGLTPTATSLVFGLSGALDMALFYPAGKLMDARGRLWIAVPSMLLLGTGMAVMPLAETVGALAAVAVLLGVANGIGSGIVMTLGADVAPPHDRTRFIGGWRLLTDVGQSAGPLLLAGGAALGSLAAGLVGVGALGVAGAGVLAGTVPRWSVHANRRTRRAAGLGPDGRALEAGEA